MENSAMKNTTKNGQVLRTALGLLVLPGLWACGADASEKADAAKQPVVANKTDSAITDAAKTDATKTDATKTDVENGCREAARR